MSDSDQPPRTPPAVQNAPEIAPDSEAEYTLEYAVVCPSCHKSLKTIKVVRLLRTRVNFVSALPRRGEVMVCPLCRSILGGQLTLL